MSELTILLSSAGRRAALLHLLRAGAATAGADLRVVATDRSPLSAAGHLADVFCLVPPVSDPGFPEAMADLVRRQHVDVIVPTIDTELTVLASHRAELEAAGARVLVSDLEAIEICADKGRSSRWLADHAFPVPHQYPLDDAADIAAEHWPLFFKPLQGSSSVGAQPVAGSAELELSLARFGPGVLEELVVGDEHTMDCWVAADGRCISVVPRLRLATRAGEIAKGVTVHNAELETTVRSMLETMPGLRGPVTVQAMVTADGPRYLEINPRFGGGYPLSHQAGAQYTAVLAAEALGQPVQPEWLAWRDGVVMLRYDDAVFTTLAGIDAIG